MAAAGSGRRSRAIHRSTIFVRLSRSGTIAGRRSSGCAARTCTTTASGIRRWSGRCWHPNSPEDLMDQKALFLKIWSQEAPTTRKGLARIPEGWTYRPGPQSRTPPEIAWLLVREEIALGEGIDRGVFEWAEVPAPAT